MVDVAILHENGVFPPPMSRVKLLQQFSLCMLVLLSAVGHGCMFETVFDLHAVPNWPLGSLCVPKANCCFVRVVFCLGYFPGFYAKRIFACFPIHISCVVYVELQNIV